MFLVRQSSLLHSREFVLLEAIIHEKACRSIQTTSSSHQFLRDYLTFVPPNPVDLLISPASLSLILLELPTPEPPHLESSHPLLLAPLPNTPDPSVIDEYPKPFPPPSHADCIRSLSLKRFCSRVAAALAARYAAIPPNPIPVQNPGRPFPAAAGSCVVGGGVDVLVLLWYLL